ncbi:HAD-IA family hydrolase [Paenibacillus mendelii]|uniref:HAD-IA family hydrolase n=1 Tax=Paenibacillus mendelii TaxID=206163 RepID=A0ABV6JBB1_9BACL|nr:HAD-IA family hydrolase [Paenibacillus mendelii]MCQ6562977.1 HAD-IA family hydrolase [Paenibacillus mendelii]
MSKPQLIFDIAGVLVSNLSSGYWNQLARSAGVQEESFKQRFKEEIRIDLWTGRIDEGEFWAWIKKQWPAVDTHQARLTLLEQLVPLPAFALIPQWSLTADIHLLSNHRQEWLEPVLEPLTTCLKSITISSEAGCCKPDPAIYELVQAKLNLDSPMLFIDDQKRNLKPARKIGWNTMLADASGEWIKQVEHHLQSCSV